MVKYFVLDSEHPSIREELIKVFGFDFFDKIKAKTGVKTRKKRFLYIPSNHFPDSDWPANKNTSIFLYDKKSGQRAKITDFGISG